MPLEKFSMANEYQNIHSEKYVEYIKDLAEDDDIKAVVGQVFICGSGSWKLQMKSYLNYKNLNS